MGQPLPCNLCGKESICGLHIATRNGGAATTNDVHEVEIWANSKANQNDAKTRDPTPCDLCGKEIGLGYTAQTLQQYTVIVAVVDIWVVFWQ